MHEDIINRYIQSYNDRDIEGMLDCVTEDVIFENISNASQSMRLEGREQMGEVARLSGNAFSYRRQRLINLIIEVCDFHEHIGFGRPFGLIRWRHRRILAINNVIWVRSMSRVLVVCNIFLCDIA